MPPVSQAVLLSWSVPPAASFALVLTAFIYLRGWILLRRAGVPFVPLWRATAFLLGLLSLWVALASPLDTFSGFVLTAHMLQHMMLMMVAPPLVLLGAPLIPLVRGLPLFAAREFAGPFLNWRVAVRAGNAVTQPVVALLLMGTVMFAWHTPRLYELALASSSWHNVEHACFFLTSLVFWWPVLQPWPSRAQWPRWAMVPYLFLGDLQNTVLSAVLVFSDRVLYPSYEKGPRLFGFSAPQDQAAAGAIMWVIGSLVFVVPAVVIAIQCLSTRPLPPQAAQAGEREAALLDALFAVGRRLSFAGRFLRRRWSEGTVEAVSFVVLFAVSGLGLAALASAPSDDDDQGLLLSQASGPLAVSIFGAKGPLEAGPGNFSALIQDRNTSEVLQDATVDFRAQEKNRTQPAAIVRASTADSENKLLQSAEVNLPSDGDWTLSITVHRNSNSADFILPLHVAQPTRGIVYPWPYLTVLAFAALLLLAYVRRHSLERDRVRRRQVETELFNSYIDSTRGD